LVLQVLLQLALALNLVKDQFVVFCLADDFIELLVTLPEGFVQIPNVRLALNDVIEL
jgi:hypothetical protein